MSSIGPPLRKAGGFAPPRMPFFERAADEQAADERAAVRLLPSAELVQPVSVPLMKPAVGSYFELFRACGCGHSSAWHSGAFGAAWRAGQQVRGACEVEDGPGSGCGCLRFSESTERTA